MAKWQRAAARLVTFCAKSLRKNACLPYQLPFFSMNICHLMVIFQMHRPSMLHFLECSGAFEKVKGLLLLKKCSTSVREEYSRAAREISPRIVYIDSRWRARQILPVVCSTQAPSVFCGMCILTPRVPSRYDLAHHRIWVAERTSGCFSKFFTRGLGMESFWGLS